MNDDTDLTHECPAPGCLRRVRNDMLACSRHYHALPQTLKRNLYRTWADGRGAGTPDHAQAMRDCATWWEHNL